jgi:glycosyltransferase involved in cell wall biosynthesis
MKLLIKEETANIQLTKDESNMRQIQESRQLKLSVINEHALYFNGGIRYLYEVTKRLAKWCKVDLIVQDISTENDKMFSDAGVEVCDMMETTANKLRYWLFYPYYLIKHSLILRGAQRLYNYDAWVSSSPTTHIMCMLADIKPIIVVFELNPWLYSPIYQKGLSKTKQTIVKVGRILAKFLEKRAYKNAKRIIVYSEYIQSEVKRVYGVESEVVYTGVDTDFFKPTHNSEIEAKYKGKQIILHVASYLSPMKGTDLAVEAMGIVNKEFPHALLLIINSHNDIDRQYELNDKANACGAYIRFVTSVKDDDLPVYYTMATCLLSPSLDENVHLPVLEASACECPSVCLQGTILSEDIINNADGDDSTGYIARTIGDLPIGVRYFINYKNAPKIVGKSARQFVMERFNWDRCLSEYKRIIYDVISK